MVRWRIWPRNHKAAAFLFLVFILIGKSAFATSGITFHGKIMRPDGVTPVNSPTTQFRIQIRSPGVTNCLLWEEQQTKDLSLTNGIFTLTIADTSEPSLIPNTLPFTIEKTFSNRSNMTGLTNCSSGTTYNPNASDGRNLQVYFRELPTDPWEQMPLTKVNYVPLALNSVQLEGYQAAEFLKIDPLSSYTPLTAANVTTLMDVISGTSAMYLKPTQGFSGDVSGTYNATSVDKVKGIAVAATVPTAGQVLKYNGAAWAPAADDNTPAPGDASYSAKGVVQINTDLATSGLFIAGGVLALPNVVTAGGPTGNAQTIPVITYDQKGRLTTVTTATVNDTTKLPLAGGSMTGDINMGTHNISNATNISATNASVRTLVLNDNDTNTITVKAPTDVTANYNFVLPATAGTNGYVLSTDGSGNLSWINGSSGSVTSISSANNYLTVTSPTTTPVLTVNVGTAANTLAAGDDARITGALQTAVYDADVLPAASCTTAQTPYWNGVAGTWACQNINVSSAGGFFKDGGNYFGAIASLGTNDNFDLSIKTNNTAKMTILKTGEVGIGTPTPSSKLAIETTSTATSGTVRNADSYLTANPATNSTAKFYGVTSDVEKEGASNVATIRGVDSYVSNWGSTGGTVTTMMGGSFYSDAGNGKTATNSIGVGAYADGWGGSTSNIIAGDFLATKYSGGTTATVKGLNIQTDADGGTVTDMFGTDMWVGFYGSNITNMYGQRIKLDTNASTVVGNFYGLYIDAITTTTAPPTGRYGIYQVGANDTNYFNGKVGIGTTSPATKLDVAGGIRIGAEMTACAAGLSGTLRYNAGAVEYCNGSAWSAFGVSGAGLTSLNAQTGSTQTFAVGAAGTAPAISSASDVHTLNIPLASGAGVTSGTITKTDYDSFVAKLTSPLTTKGDLLTFSTVNARLPAGTDGQVLQADSAQASGLKWATPNGGTVTSVTSANSYLSVATTTTTPVITANVGTTANTLAAGDDSRIIGAFINGGNTMSATATLGTNSNHNLEIETNGTTKMTVLADGKVGIGTTGPTSALEINSGDLELNSGSVLVGGSLPRLFMSNNLADGNSVLGGGTPGTSTPIFGQVSSSKMLMGLYSVGSGGFNGFIPYGSYSSFFGFTYDWLNPITPAAGSGGIMAGDGYVQVISYGIPTVRFDANQSTFVTHSNVAAEPASILLQRGRGTDAAPLAVQTGDSIGNVLFRGSNAGGYDSGIIEGIVDSGTIGNHVPTKLNFLTSPGGATAPVQRMSILANGNIGLGNITANTTLDINGAVSHRGMAAPALSPGGQGRMYFDSTSNTYKISQNGGAYADILTSATATGDITDVVAGAGLTGGATSGSATVNVIAGTGIVVNADDVAVDVGTAAGKIVQVQTGGKLPALDGSDLTNLDAGDIATGTLPIARGGTGQVTAVAALNALLPAQATNSGKVLQTNGTNATWVAAAGGVSSVTSANSYLSIATTTTTPVITANVGTAANTLAAGDDSRITGALQTTVYDADVLPAASCTTSQTPYWNSVAGTWACQNISYTTSGNVIVGSQTNRTIATTDRGQLALGSTFTQTINANATVDWNNGNIQEINSFECDGSKSITFTNTHDGAAYSLLLSGDAAHSGTCSFIAAGRVFKTSGGPVAPATGKDILFTFAIVGNTIVYNMTDNLQ